MSKQANTIQLRQNGMILPRFVGWRLHRSEIVSGIVGKVVCYSEMVFGHPGDPRCGKKVTSADFGGPVTVEVFDAAGRKIVSFGLASQEEVARHPNCTATAL